LVAVKEVMDEGYIVAGNTTGYGVGGRTAFMIMLDTLGNKKWEKIYDTPYEDSYHQILILDNKEFLMTGTVGLGSSSSNTAVLTAKMDTSGKFIWARSHKAGTSLDRGIDLIPSKDGNFLISGYSENSSKHNLLMKIDTYGNVIWSNVYSGNSSDNETIQADNVQELNDGSIYLLNYAKGLDGANVDQTYLLKTNACGEAACNYASLTLVTEEVVFTITSTNTSAPSSSMATSISLQENAYKVQDSLICEFDYLCQLHADFVMDTACFGDTVHFTDLSGDSLGFNVTGWRWYFGDGDSAIGIQNPSHIYPSFGFFNAKLVVFNDDTNNCSDTIIISKYILKQPTAILGPDTAYCLGQQIILSCCDSMVGIPPWNVLWSDTSTLPTITINSPGKYWVYTYNGFCDASDTVNISFLTPPVVYLGPDTTICLGDSVKLSMNTPSATFLWSDSSISNTLIVKNTGTYWIRVKQLACEVYDTIHIQVNNYPIVSLGPDTTFCWGDSLRLFGGPSIYSYFWWDSTSDTVNVVDTGGLYWVMAGNGPCYSADTLLITTDIPPTIYLGQDSVLCQGDSLLLNANVSSASYLWNDNSTSSTLNTFTTGNYWVIVTKGVCIRTDSITLTYEDSLSFNLGSDTTLCQGELLILNASQPGATYQWSDNSTTPTLSITQSGKYWVMVQSAQGACASSDSIDVVFDVKPQVNLGPDAKYCEGDSLLLNAGWPGATYLWSNSSSDSSIIIASSGIYFVTVFAGACYDQDSINLQFYPYPVFDLQDQYDYCAGDSLLLEIDSTFQTYAWSTGDSTFFSHFYLDSGIQWITALNGPCALTDSFHVNMNPLPYPLDEYVFEICELKYVDVDAGNPGAIFNWSDGQSKQIARFRKTGLYFLTIITNDGCAIDDSCEVIYCDIPLNVPNTITPNGDGKNDTWIIESIEFYAGNTVQIFNRNGQLLFETTNYQNDWNGTWNGKELPATVYFYVVDLNNGSELLTGTITIVREK
jgi:gliding motility-associated-like protein